MNVLASYQVYAVSVGILLILLIRVALDREPHFIQFKLFLLMLASVLGCLLLELATWVVDGQPGLLSRVLAYTFNTLLFIFNVVPVMVWILYVHYQIYQSRSRLFEVGRLLVVLLAANAVMALLSVPFGFYFYLDGSNVFHRGPLHWTAAVQYFAYLSYVLAVPYLKRKFLPPDIRLPFILFAIPSVIGVGAQMAVYGLNLTWAGASLSLLIIYTSIQTRILTTDYLTGLYNRRQLDSYLQHRLKVMRPKEKLAILMMDIDKFKSINDKFGHNVGDQAIEATAALLRKTFHHHDFIARYGGDEFAVVLEYKHDDDLLSIRHRLRERCDAFNAEGAAPFSLSISVGIGVYSPEGLSTPAALLKAADEEMYRDKKRANPFLYHRP